MWNSNGCAAMAIAAGLAAAAATPASAWYPQYYGAVSGYGGCGGPVGYYGAAYGYGGGDYGYAGTFTYGWPYATNIGVSYGAYGAAYGYGGYGAAYGYGGGWPPFYSSAGWGCGRSAHRLRGYGYAVAFHRANGSAVASYRIHRAPVFAYARAHSSRFAAATHSGVVRKPAQSRIAYRTNPKPALAG